MPSEEQKTLTDEEVAEIGVRAPIIAVDDGGICVHRVQLTLDERDALCHTVRALRADHPCGLVGDNSAVGGCGEQVLAADGFRCADCLAWFHRDCINEHFKLDAYVKKLRELREQGAIDDWKKSLADKEAENTALREQLAESDRIIKSYNDQEWKSNIALRDQLAQEQERVQFAEKLATNALAEISAFRDQLAQVKGTLQALRNCQTRPRCESCAHLIRAALEKL